MVEKKLYLFKLAKIMTRVGGQKMFQFSIYLRTGCLETGYAFIATDTYKKKKMVSSAPQKILFHKPSPL